MSRLVVTKHGERRPLAANDLTGTVPVAKRAARSDGLPPGLLDPDVTPEECVRKLEQYAENVLAEAKMTFKSAAAKVEREARERAARKAEKEKSAEASASVAELHQQFEREARELEPNTGLAEALARFAQTDRGQHLNRQIEIAMQHEHEQRKRVAKATAPPSYGTHAASQLMADAASQVGKSAATSTLAKSVDALLSREPERYAKHLAEVRGAVPGTSAAWAEIERLANELVTKSARPITKAKAIDQVCLANRELWAAARAGG